MIFRPAAASDVMDAGGTTVEAASLCGAGIAAFDAFGGAA
jgi:hypothetical protein